MALIPDITELLARARADLRMGVPVVLSGHGADALVVSAETVSRDRLAILLAIGTPVLAVTARRAETLKARAYDGDLARLTLPPDVDCQWIRAVSDPADDLRQPMKGPFFSKRDGDAALARLAISLVKSAHLLPSAIVMELAAPLEQREAFTTLDAELAGPVLSAPVAQHAVVRAHVPVAAALAGQLHVFRPGDGREEHYAFEIGSPERSKPVLARLHSACFTGDVLGSLKCDCGPQLNAALSQMGQNGAGVLLYLSQEGRGIGLANKMRAYSLQDQGFDTVEANHRLGFEDDERDFRIGADILRQMGFGSVRLMTNNPNKISMMQKTGIDVAERVALKVGKTDQNRAYLATKAAKSGHML